MLSFSFRFSHVSNTLLYVQDMLHIIPLLHLMQHFSSQTSSFPLQGKNNKFFCGHIMYEYSNSMPTVVFIFVCVCVCFKFMYTQKEPVACTPAWQYPLLWPIMSSLHPHTIFT
jgi:hypothetical protein